MAADDWMWTIGVVDLNSAFASMAEGSHAVWGVLVGRPGVGSERGCRMIEMMSDSPVRITFELQMPAVAPAERGVSGRLVVYADLGVRATTVELSDAVLRELESCESFQ